MRRTATTSQWMRGVAVFWITAVGAGATGRTSEQQPDAAPAGRLRGEVREPNRAARVPGATVAAAAEADAVLAITSTDAQGFFAIDAVPAGRYRVVAAAAGFALGTIDGVGVGGPFRAVIEVPLRSGAEQPLALDLGAGGKGVGALDARIVDDQGRALPGVLVRCEPVGHRADPVESRTGPDGSVTVDPLPPGRWGITLSRAGWTRLHALVSWRDGRLQLFARLLPSVSVTSPIGDLLPVPSLRD